MLNFDDQGVSGQDSKLSLIKGGSNVMSDTNLSSAASHNNFDPNLLEYCGTDGFPYQLW